MIKYETVGMLQHAVVNPVITLESDVHANDFITLGEVVYLVSNEGQGDKAYEDSTLVKAGEFVLGYKVEAWKDEKLVIELKHIDETASSVVKDVLLKVKSNGKLEIVSEAPASGVYFKVTDVNVMLTEKAVKAVVLVA